MKKLYSVDNCNRLVVRKRGKDIPLAGKFRIDRDNQLTYCLNIPPAWRRKYKLPPKISFEGSFRLNENYDLEFVLSKVNGIAQAGSLILKGTLFSGEEDKLVFEVKSYDKRGLLHLEILKLTGFWQADEHNRIIFQLKTAQKPQTLALEGAWEINDCQQISYAYEKIDLKTKTKTKHTLEFRGYWQINGANRLSYILAHSQASRFDFRLQLESPNLHPQEGAIKYRIGIGCKETAKYRLLTLFGVWKFSRALGVLFEMDYGDAGAQQIEFGAEVLLSRKDNFIFSLTDKQGEPLGITLTFTHSFLKKLDAQVFLRLRQALEKETRLEAGVRIPF